MQKSKVKSLDELWNLIDKGIEVNWVNDSYSITIEDSMLEYRKERNAAIPWTNRKGKCLRVTCKSNYFGSLLDESELNQLYYRKEALNASNQN